MSLVQELDKKIREYEGFKEGFLGNENAEKRLIFCLFITELNLLRNEYFKEKEV